MWDAAAARRAAQPAPEKKPITITLPDGNTKEGVAFETSPLTIALGISKQLAGRMCCAEPMLPMYKSRRSPSTSSTRTTTCNQMSTRPCSGICKALEGDSTPKLRFDSPEGRSSGTRRPIYWARPRTEVRREAVHRTTREGGFYYAYMGTSWYQIGVQGLQQMVTKMCNAKHKLRDWPDEGRTPGDVRDNLLKRLSYKAGTGR